MFLINLISCIKKNQNIPTKYWSKQAEIVTWRPWGLYEFYDNTNQFLRFGGIGKTKRLSEINYTPSPTHLFIFSFYE